ncbi:MAG: type IV pilin-like G/H family protein [Chroococcidiopsis sp.]
MKKTLILKLIKFNKTGSGFTLIELLVSIIIIGILASIALPSFLNQTNRARQTEAKLNLSSLNRAQQAFYLENSQFVTNVSQIGKLGIGIVPETENYSISFSAPEEGTGVVMVANAKGDAFKSYAAGIGLGYQSGSLDPVTLTTLCESTELGQKLDESAIAIKSGVASFGGGEVTCGNGTVAAK